MKTLSDNEIKKIKENRAIRRATVEKSFMLFFEIYFNHYISAPLSTIHKNIIKCLENENEKFLAVMAFR